MSRWLSRSLALAAMTTLPLASPIGAQEDTVIAVEDPAIDIAGGRMATRGTRVINGEPAEDGAYPFMAVVNFQLPDGVSLCGGALIAPKWILTAAHCVQETDKRGRAARVRQPDGFRVGLGASDRKDSIRFSVKRVIPHPEYSRKHPLRHDIALLELEAPVAQPVVSLPESGFNPWAGLGVRIVGWGTTEKGRTSRVLNEASTKLISRQKCQRANFRARGMKVLGPIDTTRICADVQGTGGNIVDSCQGDSGGPLLADLNQQWVVVGVVSYGHKCGLPDFYGVYTNVGAHMDWVRNTMGVAPRPTPPAPPAPSGLVTTADNAPPAPTLVNPTVPAPTTFAPQGAPKPPAPEPTSIEELFALTGKGGITVTPRTGPRARVGDTLSFEVTSSLTGKLFVFDVGTSGDVRQIFPNDRTRKFRVRDEVRANRSTLLPGPRDGFRLKATGESQGRWIVALVMSDGTRMANVAKTRGLSAIPEPKAYLDAVLEAAARPCQRQEVTCAAGAVRIDIVN